MHTHTPYDDVNDWLTVGGDVELAEACAGQNYRDTVDELLAHGVTHVIDARSECCDSDLWYEAGLPLANYCYAPIVDQRGFVPPEAWFQDVENFVRRFVAKYSEGDRLYVHCFAGVNRGPSVAMLALLTVNPDLSPMEAFLQVREARPVAQLIYAEHIGMRHLLNTKGLTADDLVDGLPSEVAAFRESVQTYWSPSQRKRVRDLRFTWLEDDERLTSDHI